MVVYVYTYSFFKSTVCIYLLIYLTLVNIKDALLLGQANLQHYWDCLNSLLIIVYLSVFNVLGKNTNEYYISI